MYEKIRQRCENVQLKNASRKKIVRNGCINKKIRQAIFVDNIAICIYLLELWRSIIHRIVNMPKRHSETQELGGNIE